jgi:hypothetical protein
MFFFKVVLIDIWHKNCNKWKETEKQRTDKYKEITNDWNYDVSYTLTSLPVSDLENFKRLFFVAQSVYILFAAY